jgi:hypothetical protein
VIYRDPEFQTAVLDLHDAAEAYIRNGPDDAKPWLPAVAEEPTAGGSRPLV